MQRIFQKGKIHRRDIILFFLWIPLVSLIVTGIATDKPTIFGVRPMIVVTDSMVPAKVVRKAQILFKIILQIEPISTS